MVLITFGRRACRGVRSALSALFLWSIGSERKPAQPEAAGAASTHPSSTTPAHRCRRALKERPPLHRAPLVNVKPALGHAAVGVATGAGKSYVGHQAALGAESNVGRGGRNTVGEACISRRQCASPTARQLHAAQRNSMGQVLPGGRHRVAQGKTQPRWHGVLGWQPANGCVALAAAQESACQPGQSLQGLLAAAHRAQPRPLLPCKATHHAMKPLSSSRQSPPRALSFLVLIFIAAPLAMAPPALQHSADRACGGQSGPAGQAAQADSRARGP